MSDSQFSFMVFICWWYLSKAQIFSCVIWFQILSSCFAHNNRICTNILHKRESNCSVYLNLYQMYNTFIISITEVKVSNTSAVNVHSNYLSKESCRVTNVQIKAQIRFANSDYLDSISSLTTRLWCWHNNTNTGSMWILLSGKRASLTASYKPVRLWWYKHPYIT